MATLTPEQKGFIVQRLACFRTPSEVVEDVKEVWPDLDLPREQVRNYNPLQVPVAKRWTLLFEKTREAYLTAEAEVGIAHRVFRLEELERLRQKALSMGHVALALQVLKEAREETSAVPRGAGAGGQAPPAEDFVADPAAAAGAAGMKDVKDAAAQLERHLGPLAVMGQVVPFGRRKR